MNSSYLQFVFAMVLVINGIMCDNDQEVLHCENSGIDGTTDFTVAAGADDEDVSLDVNANITCTSDAKDTEFSFNIVCPAEWRIILRVPRVNDRIVVEAYDHDGEVEPSFSSEKRPTNYPIFLLSQNSVLKISAAYPNRNMGNKTFMLSVWMVIVIEQIDPDPSDSSCEVNPASMGRNHRKLGISCPTNSSYVYDIALISFVDGDNERLFMVMCWYDVSHPPYSIKASCRPTSSTPQVKLMVKVSDINLGTIFFLRFAPDSSVGSRSADPMTTVTTTGQSQSTTANPTTTVTTITPPQPTFVDSITRALTSNKTWQPTFANTTTTVKTDGSSKSNSGKRITLLIVVPTVVVLVAVFLLVALVATIRRKRRNKQASEGNGTIALNIRSTVNQNEKTAVYNEIGEQDYNTLFGGKERGDYHEYNVPDRPQERTSVDRTRASGSGPYQELFQDGTHAVAAVNRSPGVTGHRHGVAGDLHAYQDIRQDDRSVSGSHPNREMPNQLLSKDTPATENGYQAVKTATPEYATLEPSPEYATLEQNDESMTATSDVSGPPSDKQYDTLQRSINTVGQPPSAGYGTLKPMNEADADYESPDGYSKTTSDVNDSTRPTEALPNNQPKTRHPGAYGDDDYQTPIEPAEDLTNAYQTLDNPGYQQEPDTQAEEYSQLQRSLGAKLQSHPSSNHDNSDSYGKLHLNGTP